MGMRILAVTLSYFGFVAAAHAQAVRLDVSSAALPFAISAAKAFRTASRAPVEIKIESSATFGGIQKLCRNEVDAAFLTRALLEKEREVCRRLDVEFVEVSLAQDAITIVVNPRNSFLNSVTVQELRYVWGEAAQGKVTRWNQVNPAWPDAPLKLYAPDAQLGDSTFFNTAVLGTSGAGRRDYTASADDSVLVRGVARDPNALGYIPLAYYEGNRSGLRAIPVAAKPGAPAVSPSPENVARGLYRQLTRPLILYVNVQSLARPEVAGFVEFLVANGSRLAKAANYVPLSDSAYRAALVRLKARPAATVTRTR